ncbi:MAG: acetolactate synthase I/II/III large subunit [Rhodobacteraceae bacterium HLUCCA08]|nr:MAG: acetolactate synthase I/II/III large subunit [Rhodobacteraceae bacterium HLUCCA08]
MAMHGGRILVEQLERLGVRRVFSVPGESFLAVLDGLHDSAIANIVCRHEGGAAMMAEATAKLTGQPGVAFVTRGPGAANASAGLHVAMQDSTPMVLFVGQIARGDTGREAFQEVDYRAAFGGLVKWAAQVDDAARLPEFVARAFATATAGRPGPVLLALPEDMLSAVPGPVTLRPPLVEMGPDWSGVAEDALAWLAEADRPLVIVGGPHWSPQAAQALGRFASAQGVPVALGFRRQDYLDNRHPCYAGDLNVGMNPALAARVKAADRLMVIGSRLGDIETRGYTLVDPAGRAQRLLHVHAGPEELGRVHTPDLAVNVDAVRFVTALARLPGCGRDWAAWTGAARAEYEAWAQPVESPGAVKLENVVRWLSEHLPETAIVTNGAGNYAAWGHRYFAWKRFGTQLAPTSGSMGYGFPAAVAAALEHPDRQVVCLAGDGCFQMTLTEMSTAVQHGAAPVVIVANNGRYGTIRMHQEKTYPGRVSGTDLVNPDFAALARAYGGHGERVDRDADFADAFERAVSSGLPAVIDLALDPEALSTGQSLSAARAEALARG